MKVAETTFWGLEINTMTFATFLSVNFLWTVHGIPTVKEERKSTQ
jgi:hypothetical protein